MMQIVILTFYFAEQFRYRALLVLRKGLRVITPSLWMGARQIEREQEQDRRLEDIDEKTDNIEAKVESAVMPKPSAPRLPPPVAQVSTLPRTNRLEPHRPRFPQFVFLPAEELMPIVYREEGRETKVRLSYAQWCEKRLRETNDMNREYLRKFEQEKEEAAEAARKKEKDEEDKLALQGAVGGVSSSTPNSSASTSDPSPPRSDFWTSGSSLASPASPILAGSSGSASSSPRDLSSGMESSFLTSVSE